MRTAPAVFALIATLALLGCCDPAPRSVVAPAMASVIHIRCLVASEDPAATDPETISLGSAVVIRSDGRALTAGHCVRVPLGRTFVRIETNAQDGAGWEPAEIIERSTTQDLALIRAGGKHHWHSARVARKWHASVGDTVYAIGCPFGLPRCVARGIISAPEWAEIPGDSDRYLQTDAGMNPGCSGGGLFNARGELIGILDAILNPQTRTWCGLGYVEPVIFAGNLLSHP